MLNPLRRLACGRRAALVAGVVVLAGLTGCGDADSNSSTSSPQCWNDAAPGTVSTFASGVGPSEGIAFLDGTLYISGGGGVRRLSPDGTATRLGDVPGSIGMVAWKGDLYIASQSVGGPSVFCGPGNQGAVWRLTPSGAASIFARGFNSPNFIVATPWGTLLVADDCPTNKNLYEVDAAGQVSVWNSDITSANGMGFTPTYDGLFVVNTFVRQPALYKVAVSAEHAAGNVGVFKSLPTNSTPDGMAVDIDGNAYVALNILGTVRKVAADGSESDLATGLTTPASFAFGNGRDYDPCSMYVTSLTGEDVSRVVVGKPGNPLFVE